MRKSISVDDAMNTLLRLPVTLNTEPVSLGDSLSRVTAEDITAKIPVPPFKRSPYDGYAVRSADTKGASRDNPVVLKITEELPAGKHPEYEVVPGTAAKILTGAPMPVGADSTVKYEDTEFTESQVRIFDEIAPDSNVIYAGADVMPGALLASAGTFITAPVISSLANQGIPSVTVYKKPVITIINTGSELCEVGEELRPAAIYNSNVYTLIGYLTGVGAVAVNGGVVPDEPHLIARKIDEALSVSDMVITTGGASVGDYDWAVTAAEQLGEVLFWKTQMRPGGAMVAAVREGKVILGLSGNPVAAVTGLLRVAMPYIKKLCGRVNCHYETIEVLLKKPLLKASPKTRVLRGRLEFEGTCAYFTENTGRGNEMISSLIGCDLLAEIPIGSPPLPSGTVVKAYRI